MKEEFSSFISWDKISNFHGHKMVREVKNLKSRRGGPTSIDRVCQPEVMRESLKKFRASSQTDEDLRDLTTECLSVLKLGFVRPYIRDIQLREDERSILDRRVETSLQDPKTGSSMWGKFLVFFG